MMADGDEFTGVSFSVKGGSYTPFDPAKEFASASGSTISFNAGVKFTNKSDSSHLLAVTVPAACKVRIYAVCITWLYEF